MDQSGWFNKSSYFPLNVKAVKQKGYPLTQRSEWLLCSSGSLNILDLMWPHGLLLVLFTSTAKVLPEEQRTDRLQQQPHSQRPDEAQTWRWHKDDEAPPLFVMPLCILTGLILLTGFTGWTCKGMSWCCLKRVYLSCCLYCVLRLNTGWVFTTNKAFSYPNEPGRNLNWGLVQDSWIAVETELEVYPWGLVKVVNEPIQWQLVVFL